MLASLAFCAYYGYDYFRWPDTDKITLFTSDSCGGDCEQARNWLQRQQVPFIEKNIDAQEEHHSRWKRAGGRNRDRDVPLAYFGEERIDGFNKTIYRIALTGYQDRNANNINQTVILFTVSGCANCKTAVDLLERKQIPFEEYDINETENLSVFKELFGRELPLMFVGNIRLDGFDPETFEFALKQVDLL